MHDYVQSRKSLIQHDKRLDVPTRLITNQFAFAFCHLLATHFVYWTDTDIVKISPHLKTLDSIFKKTQEVFLELWNYIQITYILNVITLNTKFKFWQILLYIYCLFVFGGSTVDLRYLKTFTGALGLVDVV